MSATLTLGRDGAADYRELRDPPLPHALRALALDCFAAQREAAGRAGVGPEAPRDARSAAAADVVAVDGTGTEADAVSAAALARSSRAGVRSAASSRSATPRPRSRSTSASRPTS